MEEVGNLRCVLGTATILAKKMTTITVYVIIFMYIVTNVKTSTPCVVYRRVLFMFHTQMPKLFYKKNPPTFSRQPSRYSTFGLLFQNYTFIFFVASKPSSWLSNSNIVRCTSLSPERIKSLPIRCPYSHT